MDNIIFVDVSSYSKLKFVVETYICPVYDFNFYDYIYFMFYFKKYNFDLKHLKLKKIVDIFFKNVYVEEVKN